MVNAGNAKTFSVGQLVSVDWKIGVAMASSHCDRLATPFVRLVFDVADANGAVTARTVELTYAEFKAMKKTFTDVATMIERM